MLDTGTRRVQGSYGIVSTNRGIEIPRPVGKAIIFCLISAGKKEILFKNCCFACCLVFVETIPIQ